MKITKRRFSGVTKVAAVTEWESGASFKKVCARYKISSGMLSNWKKWVKKHTKLKPAKVKTSGSGGMHEAIILLRHARDAAVVQITQDPQRFDDPVYSLAMSALRALEAKPKQ